jgi:hypothetical protein
VDIVFKVHGKLPTGGEGMAIWLTSERGSLGSNLGGSETWKGLGIFLQSRGVQGAGVDPAIVVASNNGQMTLSAAVEAF